MALKEKRGLSPVVATVLLIALAMVLAMIVFLWARGWISEQIEKKGKPIDEVCKSVSISVDSNKAGDWVGLTIINQGSIYISSVEVRQEGGGSSTPAVFNVSIAPLGTSSEIKVPLETGADKLIVYPQLVGNVKGKSENKVTTCLNSGKVINL